MNRTSLTLILTSSLLVTGSCLCRANAAPDDFVMPSRNIYCAIINATDSTLRCEIQSKLDPLPPQPYKGYCEFDWGAGFRLPQGDKPQILCISDTIAGSRYVLPYGSVWTKAGFRCVSQRTGLTCTNANGRGFFLSRERWQVF